MGATELLELARSGDFGKFETRCLELLETGQLELPQLVVPFEQWERRGEAQRLPTLAQMAVETAGAESHPKAALALMKVALVASPKNDALRAQAVELYRAVYGTQPGFELVLEASGLTGGRPVRMALKLLDICLTLKVGDTLISRMDDRVVEVTEIDRDNGLFTLRRDGRTTTLPAPEVVREYDRIAADDFRVVRQLHPDQLLQQIQNDPVAVVIGLIHAHGEMIDSDQLKADLVPRYIDPKAWSKWWTRARDHLKRSPHVIMEGRSPVMLSYSAAGRTLEQEIWDALEGQNEPVDWMTTIEGYLRETAARKEQPDAGLLQRFVAHVEKYYTTVVERRPAEALTCGLLLERLAEKGVPSAGTGEPRSVTVLRDAADPGLLLRGVPHDGLRELGLQSLQTTRPADWHEIAIAWLPTAPAGLLDKLTAGIVEAGHVAAVQRFVDAGLSDPPHHPELIYWLWKGPKVADALRLPSDDELFRLILDTLSGLGRTVTAAPEVVREFRQRAKAALALRSYARVAASVQRMSPEAAITVRRQLDRLEGLGENTPAKLLDLLRDVHPHLWAVKARRVEMWQDPDTIWTTSQGLQLRLAERDEVLNVKMPENARRIGEAAQLGDLSENSEYKFAIEERDLLRARLAQLNDDVTRARTLEPDAVPEDSVGIGSRVTLRDTSSGDERRMTFYGPFDTDVDRGIFSYQAPVSQRIMGTRVGDRVRFPLDGKEVEFEIVQIVNALRERRDAGMSSLAERR